MSMKQVLKILLGITKLECKLSVVSLLILSKAESFRISIVSKSHKTLNSIKSLRESQRVSILSKVSRVSKSIKNAKTDKKGFEISVSVSSYSNKIRVSKSLKYLFKHLKLLKNLKESQRVSKSLKVSQRVSKSVKESPRVAKSVSKSLIES